MSARAPRMWFTFTATAATHTVRAEQNNLFFTEAALGSNFRIQVYDTLTTDLDVLERWTRDSAVSLAPLRAQRRADGFVRDGHGDLHAGNIVRWQGRLTAFDCLEFDARLRCLDVIADVAFLVMDLESRGRADLAQVFLNAWLTASGDFTALRLLPWHVVYLSLVRAKVDALRALQLEPQQQPAAAVEVGVGSAGGDQRAGEALHAVQVQADDVRVRGGAAFVLLDEEARAVLDASLVKKAFVHRPPTPVPGAPAPVERRRAAACRRC